MGLTKSNMYQKPTDQPKVEVVVEKPKLSVGFLTMEKSENRPVDTVGSSRIRCRWVWKYWPDAEEYHIGQRYDVMVFQKAYHDDLAKAFNGIKIFDLCDPDWLDPRPVVEMINLCDACTTSTEALAEYLRKIIKDKPILCIPDRIDLDEHKPRGPHEGDLKKIVWFGYSRNQIYVEKALPFIAKAGVELTVIADQPFTAPQGYSGVKITNINYAYPKVHEDIKQYDAALMPPPHDYRGQFKSNNKTLTCWALGVPVIAHPDDFEKFKTAESRNAEQKARLDEIKTKWDVKISVKEYQELIEKLQKTRTK